MLVRADSVGREILEHEAGVRARFQRAAGAGHSGLRVDDDSVRLDCLSDGRESKQRRSRVAARVRDQPARRRIELRQCIAPLHERCGKRMREAVPVAVEVRVAKPVTAREVDDDRVYRWFERGRFVGAIRA